MDSIIIHDEGTHSCEIMGPTGTLVQLAMGFGSFLILIWKRLIENPRREWTIWALDTSKQIISAGLAHVLNVVLALVMTGEGSHGDSCAWYFITFALDTTIGVFFNMFFLITLETLFTKYKRENLKSGNYFQEKIVVRETGKNDRQEDYQVEDVYIDIDYLAWTLQLTIWCLIVIASKSIILGVQMRATEYLGHLGVYLLSWTEGNQLLRITFSMAIMPMFLNSFQFWIQDNYLKKKTFQTEKDMLTKSLYFENPQAEVEILERYSTQIIRPDQIDRIKSTAVAPEWVHEVPPNRRTVAPEDRPGTSRRIKSI